MEAISYPHEADKLLVADGLIRLVDRGRAVRPTTVAETRVPAAVVVSTLIGKLERAFGSAARPLGRTAHAVSRESTRRLLSRRVTPLWEAAPVAAVFLPAAVALLASLDHAVAADGCLRLWNGASKRC